jgi:acyl carrier protein
MVVSSRTPEGEPAECPICGVRVQIDPSLNFSDAPCPSCGSLLWFVRLGEQNLLFRPNEAAQRKGLAKILAELTGVSESRLQGDPALLNRMEFDSTQWIELVMELEDELSDS